MVKCRFCGDHGKANPLYNGITKQIGGSACVSRIRPGGSRAILLKNVFDFLEPDIQKSLSSYKTAYVSEVNFDDVVESPAYEYKVVVRHQADTDEIAGELMASNKIQ